ncbi:substrate-binding domain-containing protein [Coprobacillus cateniformis]|uniref:substrate-binding domain-containing protein n=1 Tax=Coprobacillus cateniformis TaxID=100884 RepID=UPI0039A01BD0
MITALKIWLKSPRILVSLDLTIHRCVLNQYQITTVQVQKELMGEVAVSNLIDRIHRKDNIPMTQLLSVKIVERTSLKI